LSGVAAFVELQLGILELLHVAFPHGHAAPVVYQLLVGFLHLKKRGPAPHSLDGNEAAFDGNDFYTVKKLVPVEGSVLHQVFHLLGAHLTVFYAALVVVVEQGEVGPGAERGRDHGGRAGVETRRSSGHGRGRSGGRRGFGRGYRRRSRGGNWGRSSGLFIDDFGFVRFGFGGTAGQNSKCAC
jgi:hypothetical protein